MTREQMIDEAVRRSLTKDGMKMALRCPDLYPSLPAIVASYMRDTVGTSWRREVECLLRSATCHFGNQTPRSDWDAAVKRLSEIIAA